MDTIDKAQLIEEFHRAEALARITTAHTPTTGAEHCRVCGDTIPEARRLLVPGTDLCVECKAEQED
ncbi:MAG: TraR/DksA C4-type zinc finger protein [Rhodospirillales bacterium]|nr:TraR/DksA C4-type zinc finger protein [Rhodospirillales bacterium]